MKSNNYSKEEIISSLVENLLITEEYNEKEETKDILVGFGEKSIKPLVEKLGEDVGISNEREIGSVLKRIGMPCIPYIMNELYNKYLPNRYFTASLTVSEIIESIGEPAVPYLIDYICEYQVLDGREESCRRLREFVSLHEEKAVDCVLKRLSREYLNEDCWQELTSILVFLGEISVEKLFQGIININHKHIDYDDAVNIITEHDNDDAKNVLNRYLKYGSYEEKLIAARILDKFNDTDAESTIQVLYNEPESKMLYDLYNISWEELELGLMNLYEKMGYKVEKTPKNSDYGADFIATQWGSERIAVQVKHLNNTTSPSAVQEVVAAKMYYICSKAEVVSTNNFSKQAKNLADITGVNLIDRDKLKWLIEKYNW
ncbi:restriction endonuclease [Methanohalobium evestigatum Z-7303]|uniref:Restriction endonuclease n=1 Tax=Methanohalobium evestigatum (strain ATCC BAA-1072 / DSM 3721 / NBRC 107634 / OCM 161 / Z-7303) TaxID=644295 RepID=D7E7M4_METEZ|nr:restriction endonuclease [Methanohalobium evestigatum]ADI74097.1 restriction endonuclease [Methanohalobium evestigatum Z-7303]